MVVLRRLLVGLALLIAGVFAAAPQYSVGPISAVDAVVDSIAPQAQALTPSQRIILKRGISPVASWSAATDPFPSAILSHSRTSLATMFDSTGKLTYAPNNLLTQSNTFSNAAWTKATMTVAGGFTDPFGGSNATRLTATGATSYIYQPKTVPTGANALTSIWVRRVSGSGTINLWTIIGSTGTAIVPASTWTQYYVAGAVSSGTAAFAGVIIQTSGDVIEVYAATASAVTYETSPRTADQVITTSAAYYGPRVDYDPNTLAVKGLLIEEARTNLAIQSEALSDASWAVGAATKSTDGTLYLNGSTANKITAITVNSNHSISSAAGVSVTSGQAYTQSFFVKAGTHSNVAVSVGAAANWAVAVFDISGTSNGTATQTGAGSDTDVSGVSTYLGGGWFRLALTFTASATGSRFLDCQMVPATTGNTFSSYGGVIWLAAGTETLYVGQPQLEVGSFATSYIPTAAASVTRAADVVQFTGTALTALQGSAGSAIVQMADQSAGYDASGGVALGGSSTYWLDLANGNMYSNSGSHILNTANAAVAGSPYRAGVAWNASGRSLAMNGGTVATDAFGGWAAITPYLGSLSGTVNFVNGHVASFAIYNSSLPDATLQSKSVVNAAY